MTDIHVEPTAATAITPSDAAGADPSATPWDAGRFDGRVGPPRLLFGRTFEDPAIELGLFPEGGNVLCIASAGDTARALAAAGRTVIAVDLNPAQIDEVGRRLAGHLPRRGAADRLLGWGRTALRPLGWRRRRVTAFGALADVDRQIAGWERMASPSVRTALRVVLRPSVLRLVYGDAFVQVIPRGFGDQLLDRIGQHLARGANRDNPWLELLLSGTWSAPEPTGGADRIELRLGDVATILEDLPAGSLDGISLSNVLDGPGPAYRERLLAAARRAGRPGAPIVVRTFLAATDAEAAGRALNDRSLLWGGIDVIRAEGGRP